MTADPKTDALEARASFTEPEMERQSVEALLASLESAIKILGEGSDELEGLNRNNPASAEFDVSSDEGRTPHTVKTIDKKLEQNLIGHISKFLKADPLTITRSTALVSLGVDSLKSVALSRFLRSEGITISAIDIVQSDSIGSLAVKASSSQNPHSMSVEAAKELEIIQGKLVDEISADALGTDTDDVTTIVCATALQSGMLSQV